MTIELGRKYQDRISKFIGIATCRQTSLHGPARVELTPEVSPAGTFVAPEWFDEARLGPA